MGFKCLREGMFESLVMLSKRLEGVSFDGGAYGMIVFCWEVFGGRALSEAFVDWRLLVFLRGWALGDRVSFAWERSID